MLAQPHEPQFREGSVHDENHIRPQKLTLALLWQGAQNSLYKHVISVSGTRSGSGDADGESGDADGDSWDADGDSWDAVTWIPGPVILNSHTMIASAETPMHITVD